ncbi:MAG TPA: dihydroneopterin aldolase [Armatimonadota bacterium]|nr:dihydroneopterin aldolase [Armatimonadota bacterium]
MDRIFITDLLLRGTLGLSDEERREPQDVLINVSLWTDLRPAGASDRIEDSVDYRALKKRIIALVDASAYHLVEALAERIAALCLDDPRVRRARVRVEKPGALRFARSVGVEITRERD